MFSRLRFLYSLVSSSRKSLLIPWGLLAFPTEILVLIVKELEWDDVLRLRTTSKLFRTLTYSKDVWTELFQRYLEVSMPTPFILPKPLSECSSAEIERIVWTSKAGLNLPRPFMAGQPHSLEIPNTKAMRLEIIPGGRWLLAGCADGSVWYYDLDALSSPKSNSMDAAPPPRLLLDSPLPEGTHARVASVQLSVDYTSDRVNPNPAETFRALEHFNLAIVVTYWAHDNYVYPKSIQIWKAGTESGTGNLAASLRAHTRLSAFFEDPEGHIYSISLHGDHLAYCRGPLMRITIVDWHSVNEKQAGLDSSFMRWCLSSTCDTARAKPVTNIPPSK
ncbi:hypothetical protein MD484_g2302, partial [Candolleomyces efflorescens]